VISRRQFLLGTGAGLILPSFFERALAYWENHGASLLDTARNADIQLFAVDRGGDGLELNWGDPWEEPPKLTRRELAEKYYGGIDHYECYLEEDPDFDLDEEADILEVVDAWARVDSPNARAYRLLERYDLGAAFSGPERVGEIRFIDGPCPGNDYLGVEAPSPLDLSLLQHRLNQLNTGIQILLA
jgi:hypothetical protein